MITPKLINKVYDILLSKYYCNDLDYFESLELDKIIMDYTKKNHSKNNRHYIIKNLILEKFKENNIILDATYIVSIDLVTYKSKKTYIFFKINELSTPLIPLDKNRLKLIIDKINEKYGRVK